MDHPIFVLFSRSSTILKIGLVVLFYLLQEF